MRLFEWQSAPLGAFTSQKNDFIDYLSGVWVNRNKYDITDDFEDEADQLQRKQRFFDLSHDDQITARNYVGVVQFEGIRVEVYPKIFSHEESGNIQKWQHNIFYWLTYCRKIRFPFSLADLSKQRFDDFLEFLIYIFANYTEETLGRQPFQAYQSVEEETSYLKGRLSFDNYTRNNLITGKWQNFYCQHEPFVYDNLFNRIIKYVAKRLGVISNNNLNKEKINEILFILHDVSDISCSAEDCDRVKLNPLFEDHKHVLDLCKLFLSNQVIDMDYEDSSNFCFLLPMEYIFEEFISGFISAKWPKLNLISQSRDYLALNQGRPVFQIRNDIYILNKLIIDTKYKVRKFKTDLKEGVSQNDLYQMISYALRRNCCNILLLYPQVGKDKVDSTIFEIPSHLTSAPIFIQVENIDIRFEDLKEADDLIYTRIKLLNPVFE